jgi:hypothetical protein
MEPLPGAELPPLADTAFTVVEASPDPPQGSARDALAALAEQQADDADHALGLAVAAYLDRMLGVTLSRMRGPTARKHTRWWSGAPVGAPTPRAVDTDYIVPAKLVDEIDAALRPVLHRIAETAGTDVAQRLSAERGDADFAAETRRAVDAAIGILTGVATRYAETIRERIAAVDADASSLDELLGGIEAAYSAGRSRLLMATRTVGTALRHDVAVARARTLGVTHAQWLSKRDASMRRTHRRADGQVRLLDDQFTVGAFRLRFPGDPTDLPRSWSEIANCRCGLLLAQPDPARIDAARLIQAALRRTDDRAAAQALVAAARRADRVSPTGMSLSGPAYRVAAPKPVVGYRLLSGRPAASVGQWALLAAPVLLGLIATTSAGQQLAVAIPAGTVVTVVGGAVLLEQTALEVIGTSPRVTAVRVAESASVIAAR